VKEKKGVGPKTTHWTRKNRPKSRQNSSHVWRAAIGVIGYPPSWMKMIPANHYADTPQGRVLCKTTRWEIGRREGDLEPIVVTGPAKKAAAKLAELNGA